MVSQKAKELVGKFEFEVGGDESEWLVAKTDLLNYIEQLENQVSDAGWEASARHSQATGGWQ